MSKRRRAFKRGGDYSAAGVSPEGSTFPASRGHGFPDAMSGWRGSDSTAPIMESRKQSIFDRHASAIVATRESAPCIIANNSLRSVATETGWRLYALDPGMGCSSTAVCRSA